MHPFAHVVVSLASALALGNPVRAADLLVEVGNPNAYQTLQAALDAAQPGDRILVKGYVGGTGVVIRKSVTIESATENRADIQAGVGGFPSGLSIETLSLSSPLTFRRLSITFHALPASGLGIYTPVPIAGEVRLDDVVVRWLPLQTPASPTAGKVISLQVDRLWIRRCVVTAGDEPAVLGCGEWGGASGTHCVDYRGGAFHVEDSEFRAGSAPFLQYSSCDGAGGQSPFGEPGGLALRADAAHTTLVRCLLSDGNGGSIETGPWYVTPRGGAAGKSQLVRPGGVLDAFDVHHEQGLDGQVVSNPDPGRGATISIGDPLAPLSVGGSGVLGDRVTLDVLPFQHSAAAMLIGHGWGLIPTPFGNVLLDFTLPVVAVPVSRPSISFGVPNDAALVHLPVVSQLFYANQGWFFGNASGLEIRD